MNITVSLPKPSGQSSVGVTDIEFMDTVYPSDWPGEEEGRRVAARVWYPAAEASGRLRQYFEGDELEKVGLSMEAGLAPAGMGLGREAWEMLGQMQTHSHVDAAVAEGSFPVLVYSHGGMSFVQQNTHLMEHLASHGYIVVSVGHPGGSAGVVYRDAEAVTLSERFNQALMSYGTSPHTAVKLTSPDIQARFEAYQQMITLPTSDEAQRWADDMKATVDALAGTGELVGSEGMAEALRRAADLERLVYAGMSFGAGSATAAAAQDDRSRGSICLDGGEFRGALLDTAAPWPVLVIFHDPQKAAASVGQTSIPFYNEFCYEPLDSMGERDDIVRVQLAGTSHLEMSDMVLLPREIRQRIGGGDCSADEVIEPVNALFLGFLDHTLKGANNGYPSAQLDAIPHHSRIDVSDVREWAKSKEVTTS